MTPRLGQVMNGLRFLTYDDKLNCWQGARWTTMYAQKKAVISSRSICRIGLNTKMQMAERLI